MSNKSSSDKTEQRIKALEQALMEYQKSATSYHTIFNYASDAIFIHNAKDGRIKEVNQSAQEMFGFSKDEILQMNILAFSEDRPPYSYAEAQKKIAQVEEEKSLLFEWRCKKKDGSLFWVEVNLKKILYNEEEMMIAMVRDISNRRESEKELNRIDKLSNAIQRLGKMGAWELDIDAKTSYWTEEVYRIHDMAIGSGFHHGDYLLKKSLACFSPDDRPVILDALKKCIEQGVPFKLEFPITTAKGRNIWVQTEAKREMTEKNGQRVIGYLRDITAFKKQEEELRAKEIKYKTILLTAVDGFVLSNSSGRIIEVNDAYCKMSGYSEEELLSLEIRDIEGQMTADELALKVKQVKKSRYERFETKHRRKDGSVYDVEISVTYLSGEGGQFVNFARNISSIKKAEKEKVKLQDQLTQIQKLESIGRLAGGVAHDLNNLLAPVLGYAQMLMENKKGQTSDHEKLRSIHESGMKAKNLVSQLLAFGRKQTLEFRLLDLDKVLLDFKALLRRTIREDIQLNIITFPGTKTIMADQTQLEQIIMNLSVNAADAMPDGGILTIETMITQLDETYALKHPSIVPGQYVLMSVTDVGQGMDQETCQKIFEPFYSTKGSGGTGLGLATVYGIVKQHSGNIWVYSEVGTGTVFKIYLPHVPGKEAEPSKIQEIDRDLTGSETILLAEDNDGVRNLAADILTLNGYRVYLAENGNEALEVWASIDEAVDLLLTDVIMPQMNGRELFETLHSLDQNIKVLYLSGYPDNAIARHGILDHNVKYIQKPFSADELLLKIRQVLDREI